MVMYESGFLRYKIHSLGFGSLRPCRTVSYWATRLSLPRALLHTSMAAQAFIPEPNPIKSWSSDKAED